MKFRYYILIFVLFEFDIGFALQPDDAAQPSTAVPNLFVQSKKVEPEVKVLKCAQVDYFDLVAKIMHPNETSRIISFLRAPFFIWIFKIAAFSIATKFCYKDLSNFGTDIKTSCNEIWNTGIFDMPASFSWNDLKTFAEGFKNWNGWSTGYTHALSLADKSGLNIAIPAYILSGMFLTILCDLFGAPKFIPRQYICDMAKKIKQILICCEDGLVQFDKENQISTKFFQDTLNFLERDYLLIFDKISSERYSYSTSIISIAIKSLWIAGCVYVMVHKFFKVSLAASFFVIVLLYRFFMPNPDTEHRLEKWYGVYKLIAQKRAQCAALLATEIEAGTYEEYKKSKPQDLKNDEGRIEQIERIKSRHNDSDTVKVEPITPQAPCDDIDKKTDIVEQEALDNGDDIEKREADFLKKHAYLLKM